MKLGLALGGGGLRGAAHIGVLEVLLENHIYPDLIAGTSSGAIVGGLYAAGHSLNAIAKFYTSYKDLQQSGRRSWPYLLLAPRLPLGLLPSSVIELGLARLLGNKDFSGLGMPFTAVATDIYTGAAVLYSSYAFEPATLPPGFVAETRARLVDALVASSAVPGIFTPKQIGRRTLVDGALVDNVPADVLKWMGAKLVIAVDLGFHVQQDEPFRNVLQVLLQTTDIMGQRITNTVLTQHADIVLRPKTGYVALWEFKKIPELIEAGRREARDKLGQIKDMVCAG